MDIDVGSHDSGGEAVLDMDGMDGWSETRLASRKSPD